MSEWGGVALDEGGRELPLARHDCKPVALELLGGGAVPAKLLTLVDERRVVLSQRLGVELPPRSGALRNKPPQSWYRHSRSIGAPAPKLRPAPHSSETTRKVG